MVDTNPNKWNCREKRDHMSRKTFGHIFGVVAILLISNPSLAHANMGLPMIFISWPSMFLALIPVVAIEAIVFIRMLKIDIEKSLSVSFLTNLTSTIVGIPLSWLFLLAIELAGAFIGVGILKIRSWPPDVGFWQVPLMAAWLGPITKEYEWMVPVAAACGLVPAYFLSVWIEFGVAKRRLVDFPNKTILYKAVQSANLVSYSLLMGLCITMFFFLRFQVK